jgi:hypothetical protein
VAPADAYGTGVHVIGTAPFDSLSDSQWNVGQKSKALNVRIIPREGEGINEWDIWNRVSLHRRCREWE